MTKLFIALTSALFLTGCQNGATPKSEVNNPNLPATPRVGSERVSSDRWWDSANYQVPINELEGITCFRGNPQRNWIGKGPLPSGYVEILWRAPVYGVPSGHWSGVGWTGQPLLVKWPVETRRWMNFKTQPGPEWELIGGALDGQVHFLDAATGKASRKPITMPGPYPIKGTISIDPRGYPLVYVGCGVAVGRNPGYRIFSLLDGKEKFAISAADPMAPRRWPGSDSNALILKDTMLLPTENGMFYKVKLNATWDPQTGKLGIAPKVQKIVLSKYGAESSMAIWNDRGYVADNAGTVHEINLDDISKRRKLVELGDDTDSSIVMLEDGSFVVGIEKDKRTNPKAKGSILRVDSATGKIKWRWDFDAGSIYGAHPVNGGVLSTGTVSDGRIFYTTSHHPRVGRGFLLCLDANSGKLLWKHKLRAFAWSSPIATDGAVFAADSTGAVYIRDAKTGATLLNDKSGQPIEFLEAGANIESSPIVWEGKVYVGLRGGAYVCFGVKKT